MNSTLQSNPLAHIPALTITFIFLSFLPNYKTWTVLRKQRWAKSAGSVLTVRTDGKRKDGKG